MYIEFPHLRHHLSRNCAFVQAAHPLLLSSSHVNLLAYLLLPLCGPEEFDSEEQEKMPEEVQLLPPSKKREADPTIRLVLVETLILLSATISGREVLRDNAVYEVIKVLHKVERDDEVKTAIERLVNLLMRDESQDIKIREVPDDAPSASKDEDEDQDLVVQEM